MKTTFTRRLLSALMALVMVFSLIPTAVFAAEESATYTKITSAEELTTGKYVMVVNTGYAPTTLDGSWILAEAVTATDDKITDPAANLVWTITVDGTNVKLTDSNGVTVAPKGGNNNGIQSGDYQWAVTCNNGTFKFAGQGSDTVVMASNKGSDNKFRGYKNNTVNGNTAGYPSDFTLYKLEEAPAVEDPYKDIDAKYSVYEKVDAPADGDVVLIYNAASGNALTSTYANAYGDQLKGAAVTVTENYIATDAEAIDWTVAVSEEVYSFAQGEMKLAAKADGKYWDLTTNASDATGWKLSACKEENSSYYIGSSTLSDSYGSVYVEWYASKSAFTAYSTGESKLNEDAFGFQFYKLVREGVPETPDPVPDPEPDTPTDVVIADGKYVIWEASKGKAATALGESATYGYLSPTSVTLSDGVISGHSADNGWTVTNVEGGITIQDSYDRYIYMSGTYNNFNVSATIPSSGHIWTVTANNDGTYTIVNAETGKTFAYDTKYDSYAAYAEISETHLSALTLTAYTEPVPNPDPDPEPEPEVTEAKLVTSIDQLMVGGEYILVAPNNGAVMGPSSGNFYASVKEGFTLSEDKATAYFDEATAQVLILGEGSVSGTYAFGASGAYLAAVSSSSNHLKSETSVSANSSWMVEISESGSATIKATASEYAKNWIRYNASSPRFSCYASGQNDVALYEVVREKPGKVTSADQFVTGTYAMVVDGGYAMGALDGTWVSVVQPVIDGDVVTDAKGGVWTLTVNGSSVQITDSNGASIKPKGGNNNGIASGSYDWAWSFDEATQTFTFAGTGSDTVKLASNANEDPTYGGFHKFRGYKNTTISGNPATYPCNFTLYKIAEQGGETGVLPNDGDKVVIYNLSAKGVLAAENDAQSIENALAEIVDGKAVPENGAVVFTVSKNGNYYRFYNETYGYLCSNGTGSNAFYTQEASEDADWTLTTGKKGGYNLESRTAKFNGQYSQYLEYYSDSYKTYSMYNVTDYDIYEFFFYGVADGVNVNDGIVNQPAVEFGTLVDAYVGADYTFSVAVNAVFGVSEMAVKVNGETVEGQNGSYTVPAAKVTGTELTITVSGTDTKGVSFSGEAKVTVKDEPVIGAVAPAAGSETKENKRPVISAEIINAGENPTITMTVGDETVKAVYADGKVTYTPAADMADGRTSVTVTVKRADGKETSKTWAFTVGEAQYQLYFGQLHSHTTYSDGSGSLESALDYVKNLPESANVDFVAFTDHSNYFDASGAANPEGALYDMSLGTAASQKTWSEYTGAIDAFNASQNDVIALGGFEMTWSGGPGHINTFNTPGIVSRNNTTLDNKTNDAGMKAYYALLSQPEGVDSISQFNHPGSTFGTFTDFAYWDAVVDTRIQLVEVGNGEGQVGAGGYYPSYEYYTMALDKGWHVAPTNNQDNHKGKWGNANDARDVVLTDDFSEAGIYQAIRDMRVYSTEDKNLEILYTVNDQLLGSSITEVPEKLNIEVTVYDPDAADSISKVEVIVNSGKAIHTWDNPAELAAGALSVELDPDYSYYYIRVTEGDGDLAVTAPVWVGEMLKLGISAVECGTSTPVTGEELTLTTTLFNSELQKATVKSLVYTINGSEVIGTDAAGYTIPASGTVGVDFKYTPEAAKVSKITVTALVEQDGKEYTFSMDITLDVQDADKLVYIAFDGSHDNEYVNGNYNNSMGNFSVLAAQHNVRYVEVMTSEAFMEVCKNESGKYKALVLTAPSRRDASSKDGDIDVYSDEELAAIKAYNEAGGTVILMGYSDYYETTGGGCSFAATLTAEQHMAAQQNKVLAALGSSLRLGDDQTADKSYNDGREFGIYVSNYGESFLLDGLVYDADNAHDVKYTQVFNQYGGSSVYVVDANGAPTSNVPATVTPVVYGNESTYVLDSDKDGIGDNTPKYALDGKELYMVLATEQIGSNGMILVTGGCMTADWQLQRKSEDTDSGSDQLYSNFTITENLLEYINPVTITDIAEVQAQTEVGYKYTIEGIVTSNASGYDKDTAFFDCIYVQDATGGICCFPVAGNYKIGDKVRVTGTTEFYQGEMELQVTSIEVIGEGAVEPKEVTAAQINDLSVIGQLITIKGTVESFELANGLVQTIMVKDAKGDVARVFIDGYITTAEDVKNLKVGCEITVTGISSYDNTFNAPEGPFPRIRIRDRADIVCGDVVVSPDTTPDTGDHTNLPLLTGAMLVSMAGILVILFAEKKRRA